MPEADNIGCFASDTTELSRGYSRTDVYPVLSYSMTSLYDTVLTPSTAVIDSTLVSHCIEAASLVH